ncbi:MAG: Formate hydrogenlyase subunit 7 [Lentisphaerae bacterium ADurb.BinA184]|nr:MAG: Formate hydrogenlyase subunit 7 [Lentisphaerae bacterium ADurb.BinA184]
MFRIIRARLRQGHRTVDYPRQVPPLPDRFRGRPAVDAAKCPADCRACVQACPAGAIQHTGRRLAIDLGRCLFCGQCEGKCGHGAIRFTNEYRLAARGRDDLRVMDSEARLAQALDRQMQRLFGRSLKLRQVSAGGCSACEADVNVLGTLVYDLGRFGIQFVASPRHADGVLVTGPITANMRLALSKTYAAIPAPKLVIAAGACAIAGGPYAGHAETNSGVGDLLPVDLYIPGCPPHPLTLLDGLLRLLGRIAD